MAVYIDEDEYESHILAVLTSKLNFTDLEKSFSLLGKISESKPAILLDLSDAQLVVTQAEFMALIEHWFSEHQPFVRTAIIYDPLAQKAQINLFETKNLLMGGKVRMFTSREKASEWLTAQSDGNL